MNEYKMYLNLTEQEIKEVSGGIIPGTCYMNPKLADQGYNNIMTVIGFIAGCFEGITDL